MEFIDQAALFRKIIKLIFRPARSLIRTVLFATKGNLAKAMKFRFNIYAWGLGRYGQLGLGDKRLVAVS